MSDPDDSIPSLPTPFAIYDPRPFNLGILHALGRYPAAFARMSLDGTAVPFESPSRTIGSIVRGFNVRVTKSVRVHTPIVPVWHPNYRDVIIRDLRASPGGATVHPDESAALEGVISVGCLQDFPIFHDRLMRSSSVGPAPPPVFANPVYD